MKLQFADDDARNITLIVSVISGLLYDARRHVCLYILVSVKC